MPGAFAASGVQSILGYNQPTTGTMFISTTLGGTLPADACMHFRQSHGFENFLSLDFYDGGQILYSTNGGANWNDAGSLISAGQSAFVADSWGYTATKLDLSSLGGGSFGYQFTIFTDSSVDEYGWFVDDVRIYTCATCLTDWVLTSAHNRSRAPSTGSSASARYCSDLANSDSSGWRLRVRR